MFDKYKSLILLACVMLGGCATITRGTTNEVQFVSEPEGAKIETSRSESCTTPCSLVVERKHEFEVTFTKEGYEPKSTFVRTQVAGAGVAGLAGNVLAGGIVGIGVDAISGASLEHVPNPVSVVLEPVKAKNEVKKQKSRKRKPVAVTSKDKNES